MSGMSPNEGLIGTEAGQAARRVDRVLVKWVTANDAGVTGSHQAGFHLAKESWPLFFERAGRDGENVKADLRIDWTGHEPTDSVVTWYGRGTRSEYRLTRFGRGFPFRGEAVVGALLVLVPDGDLGGRFTGWVLDADDDIEAFLGTTGLTPGDVQGLVEWAPQGDDCVRSRTEELVTRLAGWPTTKEMSAHARHIAELCLDVRATDGDRALATWIETEFQLFRSFEDADYERLGLAEGGLRSVDQLIELALPFVNRRKARAGASLEHHFGALLEGAGLPFSEQVRTEGSNTMDFVIPSRDAYFDPDVDPSRVVAVGAKTSARERWRQILDEADGAEHKYLLTLQPVSMAALEQMSLRGLRVIVPSPLQRQFDRSARRMLLSVDAFVDEALEITIAD